MEPERPLDVLTRQELEALVGRLRHEQQMHQHWLRCLSGRLFDAHHFAVVPLALAQLLVKGELDDAEGRADLLSANERVYRHLSELRLLESAVIGRPRYERLDAALEARLQPRDREAWALDLRPPTEGALVQGEFLVLLMRSVAEVCAELAPPPQLRLVAEPRETRSERLVRVTVESKGPLPDAEPRVAAALARNGEDPLVYWQSDLQIRIGHDLALVGLQARDVRVALTPNTWLQFDFPWRDRAD